MQNNLIHFDEVEPVVTPPRTDSTQAIHHDFRHLCKMILLIQVGVVAMHDLGFLTLLTGVGGRYYACMTSSNL